MGKLGDKVDTVHIDVQGSEATLFCKLKKGLTDELNKLGVSSHGFNVYWKDGDEDLIWVGNTRGILLAMDDMKGPLYDIIVALGKDQDSGRFIIIFQILLSCIKIL